MGIALGVNRGDRLIEPDKTGSDRQNDGEASTLSNRY